MCSDEAVSNIVGRSRTGRKGPYAHYYVQISPNNGTFVGKCFTVALIDRLARARDVPCGRNDSESCARLGATRCLALRAA